MLHCFRPTTLALALLLGAGAAQAADAPADAAPLANGSSAPLPLDELRTFAEVLDRVKAAYVEPVDDKTLLENAIKGMLSNLDPHSAYLGPEDFAELQESTSGEFGGLGIEVGSEDGFIKVVSPIDDTPAARAGIQPGDLIVQIDGKPTKGLIVYTKGRIANSELRFSADPADPSDKVPLVVLINGGSASAAEIVAGALQDQKRAILMGTDSFGKGSVQTVLPLNNDRALKLTTALYYTPSGRSIQAQGIVPDIEVGRAKVTQERSSFEGFKEADLQGHLANGNGGADRPTGKRAAPSERPQDSDYQLSQALSLLKGLSVTRGN
ncbi:S41 family peptidase [Pseudomonas aeruginosa]|uniref:S41 family peptidase n=1 Tax=Pseudomonas aeruginosa TaxID=287 RepID=UPI003D062CDE